MSLFEFLASIILLCPAALVGCVGLLTLWGSKVPERLISAITMTLVSASLLASLGVLATLLIGGERELVLDAGNWIELHEESFHFHLKFVFDRLSVPFLILSLILCGTVSAFASRYLHREPGYQRYFLLYSLFTLGMVASCVAGTVEVLFFGWELVGLSSALLVGFFHDRQAPVVNGLRVWTVYRLADAAFLLAAVALHHMTGEGDWDRMTGDGSWPYAESVLNSNQALGVGLLLLIAAAGKSALIPFSGWLPRAMEGPTASSAIFYGALSVHLGAYLLLRLSPIIQASESLGYIVVALGLSTAIYASLVERVQGDIKSTLAFASLSQVGLIVAEIGMGWVYIALIHLLGHAMMRTLQLLRAPSLLQDYFNIETALGQRIAHGEPMGILGKFPRFSKRLYRFALERGYFDSVLRDYIARPVIKTLELCKGWESRWIAWCGRKLAGVSSSHAAVKPNGMQQSDIATDSNTPLPASFPHPMGHEQEQIHA